MNRWKNGALSVYPFSTIPTRSSTHDALLKCLWKKWIKFRGTKSQRVLQGLMDIKMSFSSWGRLESHPVAEKMGIFRRQHSASLGDTSKSQTKGEKGQLPLPLRKELRRRAGAGRHPRMPKWLEARRRHQSVEGGRTVLRRYLKINEDESRPSEDRTWGPVYLEDQEGGIPSGPQKGGGGISAFWKVLDRAFTWRKRFQAVAVWTFRKAVPRSVYCFEKGGILVLIGRPSLVLGDFCSASMK